MTQSTAAAAVSARAIAGSARRAPGLRTSHECSATTGRRQQADADAACRSRPASNRRHDAAHAAADDDGAVAGEQPADLLSLVRVRLAGFRGTAHCDQRRATALRHVDPRAAQAAGGTRGLAGIAGPAVAEKFSLLTSAAM